MSAQPSAGPSSQDPASSLPLQALELLRMARWVDLTHAFDADIPHCPAFEPEQCTVLHDYATSGFLAHEYRHIGQWGTHVDPLVHFVPGARTLDAIPVEQMVLPLVVLDIHQQAAADPDYQVTLQDLSLWEHRHGPVPPESFVALRTDWSHRWPSQQRTLNTDSYGVHHYPGWSAEVLQVLVDDRAITAIGHETPDTDP